MKVCSRCGQEKPLSDFHKDSRGKDGYRAECKACKQKIDEGYRENNAGKRRRYYLSRRGHVYSGKIDSDIDGYITMLMKNEHFCWYCNKRIIGHKNLDHIVPLHDGGTHTKDNLAIACQSCNDSKKKTMLMEIFLQKNGLWKTRRQLLYYYHPDIKEKIDAFRLKWLLWEVIGWDLEEYEKCSRKSYIIYYLK